MMDIIDELTGKAFQAFATPYISRVALEAAEEIRKLREEIQDIYEREAGESL
jgi:hypothetical protein